MFFFYPFLILAPLFLFPILVLILRSNRSFTTGTNLPPSPPKLPIIGNLHQLGPLPHRSLRSLSGKHGHLILLHLGRSPTLVASSASAAREIMKTHDLIFASRPPSKVAKLLLPRSMNLALAPYGEHWRHLRKLCVTHLLSNKMVHSFRRAREEEVAFMIDKISSSSSSSVNMSEVLNSFANDVICRVVSGKFFREEGRNEMFRLMVEEISALLGEPHVEDYLPRLAWLDVFFGLNARAKRSSKRWADVLDEIIDDHSVVGSRCHRTDETDFIDALLSLQKNNHSMDFTLTKEHIKALIGDMFAAGTDTSCIHLEWAMAELVRNPAAMRKLKDEARGIAGGKSRIREEDLRKMSYLKAVLKEVLRLHPPVPLLVPRESMEDCEILGYKIPNRTRVLINAWAIGRDPEFWEAPEEFRPERFIGSSVDFRGNDFQLIPFGAGRRICPGLNFAVSTAELALANLVQRFDWELPDGRAGEELDMAETPGLSTRKKQRLHLVAKPCSY